MDLGFAVLDIRTYFIDILQQTDIFLQEYGFAVRIDAIQRFQEFGTSFLVPISPISQ